MSSIRRGIAVMALLVLSSPLGAQLLSVSFPNPVPTGTPITVTCRNRSGIPLWTPGGCLITAVHQGSPTGPIVGVFPCTFLGVSIPACGSALAPRTATWTPSSVVTPGNYFFEIQTQTAPIGGPITSEFYMVTINGAVPGPALNALTPPTLGTFYQLEVNAPAMPFGFYGVVMSFTTNVGTTVLPGLTLALDTDALFLLTLQNPPPQLINFSGILDPNGYTNQIYIALPNIPALACQSLHAQAGVVDLTGTTVVLTNDRAFTLQ